MRYFVLWWERLRRKTPASQPPVRPTLFAAARVTACAVRYVKRPAPGSRTRRGVSITHLERDEVEFTYIVQSPVAVTSDKLFDLAIDQLKREAPFNGEWVERGIRKFQPAYLILVQ